MWGGATKRRGLWSAAETACKSGCQQKNIMLIYQNYPCLGINAGSLPDQLSGR